MGSIQLGKVTLAAAAILCWGASGRLMAAAPIVTYTASGVFSKPAVNGMDVFKLAGQPFTITCMVSASTPPTKHGAYYAEYSELNVSGMIYSGLIQNPYLLASNEANLELSTGNPSYDVFAVGAPVQVLGLAVTFIAEIKMPTGTIAKPLIHPFAAPVVLSPTNTTVIYTESTSGTTTLTIASGTLTATIPAAATVADAQDPSAVSTPPGGASSHFPVDGLPRKTSLTAMLRSLYCSFWCSRREV